MKLNLENKVVVITGGSKGIGRAIVQGFLEEGAIVHWCSRTPESLNAATSLFNSPQSHGSLVDVSDASQITPWVESIISKSKQIDIVISNVSSLSLSNDISSWETAYQTDMRGTVTLFDAAIPHLEKSKGNIITISSVSGRDVDFTAPSPYGAFKAALIHYTAQLARTLAEKGVRANTVSPGNIYIEDGVWGGVERGNKKLFDEQMEKNPMGRMGKAEEIADAVVWLGSERAGFVSGSNLVVDGALCTGVQF